MTKKWDVDIFYFEIFQDVVDKKKWDGDFCRHPKKNGMSTKIFSPAAPFCQHFYFDIFE